MTKTPHKSFVILYRNFALPLTKFIVKRMGGNQDAADEVFARTITAAWEGYSSFKNKASFFTWICRIALNKIADYYREEVNRNSRFVAPILEDFANYDSRQLTPEQWYVLNELCNSVKDCVRLLPEDKQRLLFLRYWRGWAISKIAKKLNVSERAIEGRIYRAKQSLKEIVSSEHPEIAASYENSNS